MSEAPRIAIYWAVMALCAVHLGLALAVAGVPTITAAAGLRQTKRLRIFIDKFGQQAATFALLGGLWIFLILCAALGAMWFFLPQQAPYYLTIPLPAAALGGPIVLGAAAFLCYRGLWQRLKSQKAIHGGLGFATTLLLWAGLYANLAILRPVSLRLPVPADPLFLLPPMDSLFWRLLALAVTMSLGLAGVFTGAWLVWRRNKDDFGRDYYNFTLRLTARVGFVGQVLSLLAMAWTAWSLLPFVGELTTRLTVAASLYGLGVVGTFFSLAVVMPQDNALRHKFMLVLALVASLVAATGLLAGLATVFLPGVLPAVTIP